MKKKILSVILAAVMVSLCFSALTITAFAAMQIFVKTPENGTLTLEVESSDTIGAVRDQ